MHATLSTLPTRKDFTPCVRNACRRIPALWPLKHFVAVNPFAGLSDRPFADAAELLHQSGNHRLLPPSSWFRNAFASGRIQTRDLEHARSQMAASHPGNLPSMKQIQAWIDAPEVSHDPLPSTVTALADLHHSGRWSEFVVDEVAKWGAAYFDEGQSSWRMPWRDEGFYKAWKSAATIDAAPEFQGLKGFRSWVGDLPESAPDALARLSRELVPELGENELADFYHGQLLSVAGWSAHIQFRVRERSMHGHADDTLAEFLAVRMAYDLALLQRSGLPDLEKQWKANIHARATASRSPQGWLCGLVWQTALEAGFQRELATSIQNTPTSAPGSASTPAVQAVFCIDVRSELYRRSLESVSPRYETLGFAGFFGMPIEMIPLGERHGSSQCPVLLLPKYRIRETLSSATPRMESDHLHGLLLHKRLRHAWNAFKTSAVSCFSFVETGGLFYAWKLFRDAFAPAGSTVTLQKRTATRPALTCRTSPTTGTEHGIPTDDRGDLAYGALKNMGLLSGFARLVLLCGHGSTTTNNPYGSGLDCGACGGNTGEGNARVAAALLNTPEVRAALLKRGVTIPDTTHFIAGLHNTTTDDVSLFDLEDVPATHAEDLARLTEDLATASVRARRLRAPRLGLDPGSPDLDQTIRARSLDWSQTRPEWGLAGNAAFIAAPRERTRHLDLQGRVFLHSYNHQLDTDRGTLELILIAPVVVANWINLQYFASTMDNLRYGSGNKVIHNVVGTFGVCQGNGGDLQTGLPLQSLHDGTRWMHEPLRLSVFIEAPRGDIQQVLTRHDAVRQLVEHGWLHLFAIEDAGRTVVQYQSGGTWGSFLPLRNSSPDSAPMAEKGKAISGPNPTPALPEPGR